MTTIEIPVTVYSVRSIKPDHQYGAPASMPIRQGACWAYVRVPLDRVPLDATITSVELRVVASTAKTGDATLQVSPVTSRWDSSITYTKRPSTGAVITSSSASDIPAGHTWTLNVTSWALPRPKHGLRLQTGSATSINIRGSSAADDRPVAVVTYVQPADKPSDLAPDGGSVSVAQPILTYAGDEDMTQQQVRFSTDEGVTVAYTSAWLDSSEPRYDPAVDLGGPPTLLDGGPGIWWQVRNATPTDANGGPWSEWAYYEYDSLPTVTIVSPGATTPDGTPLTQWTVSGGQQVSWRAVLRQGTTVKDETPWDDEAGTRTWTPDVGVKVPGGVGQLELRVKDGVKPRVAAEGAPTVAVATHQFTTAVDGAGGAVDTLSVGFDDPVPVLTGTRLAGVPDEVSLFRDGVQVPLWDGGGNLYRGWAPGSEFFDGTSYEIRDYSAALRDWHNWEIRVRSNGTVTKGTGTDVTARLFTGGVWLVDPRTGDRVEVCGDDGPEVDQVTSEAGVLHVPVHGNLEVEPIRRRLARTTKSGTVKGVVLGEHATKLEEWAADSSGLRYRLVFGRVNWSVILGDYSPSDVFYSDLRSPARVRITLNWWQRRND